MVHFINPETRKMIGGVLVGQRPRYAAFTPDGKQVWVSSEVAGSVAVIDVATRKIVNTIHFQIPGVPRETVQAVGINITSDGKTAFVALGPANRVAVVDVASGAVEKYLLVGQRVWHMAFSQDGSRLYTANGVSNDMSVIDVAARKVLKSVPVGQEPWGVVDVP